ncbi:MAG: DNA polymerase/3'-5' exonuclease PolX [Candidatus Krumholzibacteria bacterium]|nr:DNA polymerase/3'-5' exonuclease PolX [Candidatus Krumholzibacteria bacterium]MDH4336858.1 DNA polymerase/3'-5' exonuclease PolX [Candidatus Krumholzibacteria bacterium]MDH5269189.1 DNA polymerase/3'-5' exonuclease PolX [Candidatus Krumholzibacteria bacterium]
MAGARKSTPPRTPLSKADVAEKLDDVAAMLEILGDNPFRIRAFYNAARAVEDLSGDLAAMVESEELLEVRGIGKSIFADIKSALTTGTFDEYEKLRARVPAGVLEMLRISGMGPKKVKAVYDKLGVKSLEELEQAGRDGKLAVLPGFGEKTQTNILAGIARFRKYSQRFLYSTALADATDVLAVVRAVPGVTQSLVGGSLRRHKETIGDVDILATAADAGPVMDAFTAMPRVATIVGKGPTKSSVILDSGIHVDLRVVKDDEFPAALHYFTGSKEHNTEIRTRAKKRGYKLNEYGLFKGEKAIRLPDEPALFKKLGLDYIPPELRENTGEIEAAEEHTLPELIEMADVRGVFHCHTTYSDGRSTLREMAEAARALGHEYFGIGDHSPTAIYANGLTPERVAKQRLEIEALNEELAPFVVFAGIESDILQDGSLDYKEDVLATFDYVVASVHGQFSGSEAQMTKRIVAAVSNPFTTMLGHPTGRLLLSRDGYPLNLTAVFEACAAHGVFIEINAHPVRLDLDWRHMKTAKEMGVKFVINPDAHHTSEIDYYRFGVGVARKGWLTRDDVLNTRGLAATQKILKARRDKQL